MTSFGLYLERWDVRLAAVDLKMAMTNHLTRLRAAGAETHAVDDVVEALLEHAEQVFAGDAGHRAGFLEQVAELRFEQPIVPARLLLLAKLQAVADDLRLPILAMLAGNEIAALDRALFCVTPLSLQEELHALAPAKPANGTTITSHSFSLHIR